MPLTIVTASVALLMVPVTALWLARFLLFRWADLTDSLLALVVLALAGSSPLLIWWTEARPSRARRSHSAGNHATSAEAERCLIHLDADHLRDAIQVSVASEQ